jgi:hypothetical protein
LLTKNPEINTNLLSQVDSCVYLDPLAACIHILFSVSCTESQTSK